MSRFFEKVQESVRRGDQAIKEQGLTSFPMAAAAILRDMNLHRDFDLTELIHRSFSSQFERNQNFKFMEFSDLPLTVARGEACFIDLYFWRRRPTTIHNHHFNGAFQCIQGSNLELEFSFTETRALGAFHSLGDLSLVSESILAPGDIVPIDTLDAFIHQNHHHDDLCINLCFRTPELSQTNIANFLFSGLRYEKEQNLLLRSERLRRFTMMRKLDVRSLDLTIDDALCLLLAEHGQGSGHASLTDALTYLNSFLLETTQVDVADLLNRHDERLEEIEDRYN